MEKEKKMRFMNVYQNLPLNERRNTIIVLGEEYKSKGKGESEGGVKKEPISWDVAFIEISNETKIGEKILDKLIKLNLI